MRLPGSPSTAGRVEVAFPLHLAFEPPDRLLSVGFDQQAQTGFHRRLLGADAAVPYGLAHQAVVDIDGVLDFTDPAESAKDTVPEKPSAGKSWFGASFKDNPDLWREASPINYVNGKTAPILFVNSSLPRFHAGRDEGIAKMNKLSIYSEVHTIQDTPHPFWLFHPWFDAAFRYIVTFLDKTLKGK